MRKNLTMIFAAFALTLVMAGCAGSYYVTEQPVEPVYERGVAPGPDYVWIDGEWAWSGGRYVYNHGYWAHGRSGHTYHRGHWNHDDHGYTWHKGSWK
jgi:hypothetical protein